MSTDSAHRCEASFIFLFLSNMLKRPFCVYLQWTQYRSAVQKEGSNFVRSFVNATVDLQLGVFTLELLIDSIIGRSKRIYIWFINGWARQTNHGSCSIRLDVETLFTGSMMWQWVCQWLKGSTEWQHFDQLRVYLNTLWASIERFWLLAQITAYFNMVDKEVTANY